MAMAAPRGRLRTCRSLARSEGSSQRFYSMSGPDPRRAWRVLPPPGTDAARNDGRHGLDGLVPRLPHARDRGCTGCALRCHREDAVLGAAARRAAERAPAAGDRYAVLGFEGKLTTSKWAALTKSSNETAW